MAPISRLSVSMLVLPAARIYTGLQPPAHAPVAALLLCCRRDQILGTWLWGSMKARNGRFDPTADLYSLSFVFAEVSRQQGAAGMAERGRLVHACLQVGRALVFGSTAEGWQKKHACRCAGARWKRAAAHRVPSPTAPFPCHGDTRRCG